MSESLNLGLPYLEAAQAQKHVTVNEALSRIDALVHLAVASRATVAPPPTPVLGDRYLVPSGATGTWSTRVGQLAMWLEGQWTYAAPREGWRLWVSDEDLLLTFDGAAWVAGGVPTTLQNMQLVGVNATANAGNKFTVSSPATLFNHAGNGHQIKINKNAASDTASILMQTGFAGRAELGTTGDDDFHFKVSADGTIWNEALTIDCTTGVVSLPQGALALPIFDAAAKGVVPASGGGTSTFLRADGAWTAPATASGLMSYKTAVGRWHVNSADTTSLTTLADAANRIDIAPWICPFDLSADQLGVLCSSAVASSLAKIVCYDSDANGRPNALLFETSSLDLGTTGFKSAAQTFSFVRGGLYWLGLRTSSTATVNAHQPYCSPSLGFSTTPSTIINKLLRRSLTFATAAPAAWSYSAIEEVNSNVPAIFLRVAA